MIKGLEALKHLYNEYILTEYPDSILKDIDKDRETIEKELKEKEKQDFVYNVLKEIIQFNVLQPEIKETDNGYSFVSGISLRMQRELENKERQLFRNWVLEECFPKELKALEIIKEKEINIHILLLHLKRFDSPIGYNALVGEKYQLAQEEYELLKEVML